MVSLGIRTIHKNNDVIIIGLQIKPRTYARAVTTDTKRELGKLDVSSMEQQVAAFLQSKGTDLVCNNIEAPHPLSNKKTSCHHQVCKQETQERTTQTREKV